MAKLKRWPSYEEDVCNPKDYVARYVDWESLEHAILASDIDNKYTNEENGDDDSSTPQRGVPAPALKDFA